MARKPTYQDARYISNTLDNEHTALKDMRYGGPSKKTRNNRGGDGDPTGARTGHYTGWETDHPEYPDYVYPEDKARDTYYGIKGDLIGPQRVTPVSGDEIQYNIDKRNAQDMARFKSFVEDSIPRGTPWARDYFEKILPGWYQSKLEIIDQKMDVMKRLINISVMGPQSIDDMMLLYQIRCGRITIPANFTDLVNGTANQTTATGYYSGLYSPKRWTDATNSDYAIVKANQQNMANFRIAGINEAAVAPGDGLYDTVAGIASAPRDARVLAGGAGDPVWGEERAGDPRGFAPANVARVNNGLGLGPEV